MKKKLIFICLFLIIPIKAFALIEVDITRGNLNPLPLAVSPLSIDENSKKSFEKILDKENIGSEISIIVENNLRTSGLFNPLNKDAFLQAPDIANLKPRFEDWNLIKAQALITGKVAYIDEKLRVEFRLWDVLAGKEMMALAFTTVPNNWRRVGHIISDKIYERLTGEKGYFDTRIIYVAEEGPKTQRKKKLAIMDQDGANNKFLTLGNELVLTPRFNPTSQMVTYLSYFKNLPRVYLLDIETGTQEVVGDFPGMTFAPRFSPDGKKIIMSFAKDGKSDIFTMDLENRIVERITNHPSIDTSPSYSPNGKFIAFNSDRSGYQQIYIMKNDGSDVKRISFGNGIYGTPVWSPRGDLIAFTKLHNGKFYIGVMRTDGTGERLLTENYYQEAPSWSPNGRVLIFYRETKTNAKGEGFSAKLWSIDLTGYNERLVTTPTDASDPSWSSLLSN
ncbi:Tol-Pal system beta propeller repeat protein TolB [Candidatus Pelagibacter sp. HTCC7211]|jgi:TolB protein|uniref:Tol-Pal system beta propeller repeat protein TolB n=1 Tax=Pelagibacter sp. (strain HTCC7211) TaxID=439493 RepID=UPI0001839E5F|nr:Tol-Pal system beta propeller repeat protein TolB [Candidatus Pelagibacter sp. HTCC7211]EDZ60249.1 Tol-Pal system beta propeller repeat protein TolB [Candidatus Pelagibacter sp. HTCC7211]MBD1151488.1 Tol-Pal system protein TolB [Pelagibacterales bacterium SAG-MED25]